MANNDKGLGFSVGLLVGGIIGVVAGILIAPKSGAETRAELVARNAAWRMRAEELAATLRERAAPTIDSVKERMAPAMDSVRERMAPVVDQVSARMNRGAAAEPESAAVASTDEKESRA
jgi:gas vesicle protein